MFPPFIRLLSRKFISLILVKEKMPHERFKSSARISKEKFQHRWAFLLKSAEAITQDTAIYIVLRRLNIYYVSNSEISQTWLPSKEDEVQLMNPSQKEDSRPYR